MFVCITFPHADGDAPGQVQQWDSTKVVRHPSQRVAWGQTDRLSVATRVWETKSGRERGQVKGIKSASSALPESIGHNRWSLHRCYSGNMIGTWLLTALLAPPWASVSEQHRLHSCSFSSPATHWEDDREDERERKRRQVRWWVQ